MYRAPGALRRKREDGKADEDGVEGDEDEDGEDSKLLSVSAGCNILSLVMRDEGIMKFVKYVSANAPGSRYVCNSIMKFSVRSDFNVTIPYKGGMLRWSIR